MKHKIITLLFFILFVYAKSNAQTDSSKASQDDSFGNMSLEQLLNTEVTVASVTNLSNRESPGIITVITAEEIDDMGAIDLTEVLMRIPGMDMAADVEGVTGLGVRGNWAHEGKVLLLINNIEMNESLYSTLPLGFHYPVEMIDRIEIIRGPGSAIYGGTAAYAVINIKLKNAEKLSGIKLNLAHATYDNTPSFSSGNIYAGNQWSDFNYSITAHTATAIKSDRTYTDVEGSSYNMAENSSVKNQFINANFSYKNFLLETIYDNYLIKTRDGYDKILSKVYPVAFISKHIQLSKKFILSDNFSISPLVRYKIENPWLSGEDSYEDEFLKFDVSNKKLTGKLIASYDHSEKINFVFGTEYTNEKATNNEGLFHSNNDNTLQLYSYSFFAQSIFKTKLANITLGCRLHKSNMHKSSFVPRIALTKTWEQFHVKALLSQAYRTPSIENIDLNTSIKPENSTTVELEAGAMLSEHLSMSINAFDMSTKNTIVYFYNEEISDDGYENTSRSGTSGIEVEMKYKRKTNYLGCAYSFYSTSNKNIIPNYAVPDNSHVLLAFPAHKLNLFGNITISKKVSLYNELLFKGPRYGISAYDEDSDEKTYTKYEPVYSVNMMLHFKEVLTKQLTISTGVKNIFNENDLLIQPYYDLHAPLPGQSREFVLKLNYTFAVK
jgi:outer membrane receptor for ferrienterochelin and colicin